MNLIVELEQEEDGRWIAEVVGIPGALAYGETQEEAKARAEALAHIAKRTGLTLNDL